MVFVAIVVAGVGGGLAVASEAGSVHENLFAEGKKKTVRKKVHIRQRANF